MASTSNGGEPLALRIPEIRAMVVSHVESPRDLLSCARINGAWNLVALAKLYKGSLNDMRFRTPDISSLNCLLVASPERFARNMSFVDHLILSPENTAFHGTRDEDFPIQPCCVEKCRAFQSRVDSQLLLNPHGKGARSIAIPFKLLHQKITDIFDLILHPRLEFLTIDVAHVGDLLSSFSFPGSKWNGDLIPPALSIHVSNSNFDVLALCQVLDLLDLKLFQIQLESQLEGQHQGQHEVNHVNIVEEEALKILGSLARHQNLEVLSLKGIFNRFDTYYLFDRIKKANMQVPWPKLRALYLADLYFPRLGDLAKCTKLESISLRADSRSRLNLITDCFQASNIANCRKLRVVDVKMDNTLTEDVEWLLKIAHGCPMLQKLRFQTNSDPNDVEMTEAQLSEVLKALPCIELLTLDITVCVSCSTLLDLSCYTPRLSAFRMTRSQLELSYESLKQVSPIRSLEYLEFEELIFEDPKRLSHPHRLPYLAREWKRVFPLVGVLPCPGDARHTYEYCDICDDIQETEDGHGEVSKSGNGDISSDEDIVATEVESPAYDSDFNEYHLRRRLWRALNFHLIPYPPVPTDYMWRTNFEIKTFGWPIVPISAFVYPRKYSSSNTEHEES